MYRILLVDDEWLELDTLEKYVDWEKMGFQVAGTAQNGREALRLLQEWEEDRNPQGKGKIPDILLTDVKMPLMDGLALSRAVHSRYPGMQIVFLSGYNDFEYVRSALAVEACGYILKPLNMEELAKTMEKVREKCSQNTKKQRHQEAVTSEGLKELLGISWKKGEESWEDILGTCNMILHCSPENRDFYVGLITIDEYRFLTGYELDGRDILSSLDMEIRKFAAEQGILPFHIVDNSYLLLADKAFEGTAGKLMEEEKELARWTTFCIYREKKELEALPQLYQEMNRFRKWNLKLYGSGHLIICDTFLPERKEEKGSVQTDWGRLFQSMQDGERQKICVWLEAWCLERKAAEGDLNKGSFELVDRVYASLISPNPQMKLLFEERAKLYQKVTTVESARLLEDILKNFLLQVSDALTDLAGDRRQKIVQQLKNIIEEEYAEPLTIEYLAGKVYMSPNYLRTLFKDYTGETVLEYMTGVRMRKAAKLLAETNLRVHEISQRIGYENPSHYCAVFKKQMGVTPNQYRNKIAEKRRKE